MGYNERENDYRMFNTLETHCMTSIHSYRLTQKPASLLFPQFLAKHFIHMTQFAAYNFNCKQTLGRGKARILIRSSWLQTGSPKCIYHTESKRQLQLQCPTNRIPLSLNNKLEGRTFKHWSTIFKGLIQHMTDHQQKVHYKAQDF